MSVVDLSDVTALFHKLQAQQRDIAQVAFDSTEALQQLRAERNARPIQRDRSVVGNNISSVQSDSDASKASNDIDLREHIEALTRYQEHEAQVVGAQLRLIEVDIRNLRCRQQSLALQVQPLPPRSQARLASLQGQIDSLLEQKRAIKQNFTNMTTQMLHEVETLQPNHAQGHEVQESEVEEPLTALSRPSINSDVYRRTSPISPRLHNVGPNHPVNQSGADLKVNDVHASSGSDDFELDPQQDVESDDEMLLRRWSISTEPFPQRSISIVSQPSFSSQIHISAPAAGANPATLELMTNPTSSPSAGALDNGESKNANGSNHTTSSISRAALSPLPVGATGNSPDTLTRQQRAPHIWTSQETSSGSNFRSKSLPVAPVGALVTRPRWPSMATLRKQAHGSRRMSLQHLRQRTSQLASIVQTAVRTQLSLQSRIASSRTGLRARAATQGSNADPGGNSLKHHLEELESLQKEYTGQFIAGERATKELKAHGRRLSKYKHELQQSREERLKRHQAASKVLQDAVGSHEKSVTQRQVAVLKGLRTASQTQHALLSNAEVTAAAAARTAGEAAAAAAAAAKAEEDALSTSVATSMAVDASSDSFRDEAAGASSISRKRSSTSYETHARNAALLADVHKKCRQQEDQIKQFQQQVTEMTRQSNEQAELFKAALAEQKKLMEAVVQEIQKQADENLQQAESLAEIHALEMESQFAEQRATLENSNAKLQVTIAELQRELEETRKRHETELRSQGAASVWQSASSHAARLAEVEASYEKQLSEARKQAYEMAAKEHQKQLAEFKEETERERIGRVVHRVTTRCDLIGRLHRARQRIEKRARVVQELVSTEERYVGFLKIALRFFASPLKAYIDCEHPQGPKGENAVRTVWSSETDIFPDDYEAIFSNLEQIVGLNEDFLDALKQQLATMKNGAQIDVAGDERKDDPSTWDHDAVVTILLDTFAKFVPHFEVYSSFIIAHDGISDRLQLLRKNPTFVEIERSARVQPAVRNFQLESLLINPIQRLPRYCMLLKEFLKHLPRYHPRRKQLEHVYEDMGRVVARCNTAANDAKLRQIEAAAGGSQDLRQRAGTLMNASMQSIPVLSRTKSDAVLALSPRQKRYSIVRTGRKFVLDGDLSYGNKRRGVRVYLFSDKLLIGAQRGTRWLAEIKLKDAAVFKTSETGFAVTESDGSKRHKFYAATHIEGDKWYNDILESIKHLQSQDS